jgi:peptidoglycan/xylan/chitin deacetylase (PgdA/CDA1 family)
MEVGINMIIHNVLISFAELFTDITPLIPYYHTVSNERLAHVCHIHPYKNERQFIDDLDFLCKRYHPVSLEGLIDFARHGSRIRKGSFIISFDDGYSQVYSIAAPILFKKGIPAIFFLVSDFIDNKCLGYRNKASIIVEYLLRNHGHLGRIQQALFDMLHVAPDQLVARIMSIRFHEADVLDEIARLIGISFDEYLLNEQPYLTSAQIRKLIDMGFKIGAHSLDHRYYQGLPLQDQLKQTIDSLHIIKNSFRLDYSVFAFPHSDLAIDKEFFLKTGDLVDVTFGTLGIKKDPIASNLQRLNFEKTLRPASEIVARQLIKKIVYGRFKSMSIDRGVQQ